MLSTILRNGIDTDGRCDTKSSQPWLNSPASHPAFHGASSSRAARQHHASEHPSQDHDTMRFWRSGAMEVEHIPGPSDIELHPWLPTTTFRISYGPSSSCILRRPVETYLVCDVAPNALPRTCHRAQRGEFRRIARSIAIDRSAETCSCIRVLVMAETCRAAGSLGCFLVRLQCHDLLISFLASEVLEEQFLVPAEIVNAWLACCCQLQSSCTTARNPGPLLPENRTSWMRLYHTSMNMDICTSQNRPRIEKTQQGPASVVPLAIGMPSAVDSFQNRPFRTAPSSHRQQPATRSSAMIA